MKAIVLDQSGAKPTPKLVERPIPVPGPGEVVVQVKAAGLNFRELYWAENGNPDVPSVIMGGDGAGLISAVGPGVKGWQVGDRVVMNPSISCGECYFCRHGHEHECAAFKALGYDPDGTFAEYVKVPTKNLSLIPAHMDFVQAASLPVAIGTAWNVLFSKGELKPGQTVLIHGVGGGVALFALQLAAAAGALTIVTSGSDEKLERAKALGATHGINYRTSNVLDTVRELTGGYGADLTIDGIGKETLAVSFQATSVAGTVVRYGSLSGGTDLPTRYLSKTFKMGHMATAADWADMMRFVALTGLQPVVDKTFPLEQFEEAFAYLKGQQQFGKVVLTLE